MHGFPEMESGEFTGEMDASAEIVDNPQISNENEDSTAVLSTELEQQEDTRAVSEMPEEHDPTAEIPDTDAGVVEQTEEQAAVENEGAEAEIEQAEAEIEQSEAAVEEAEAEVEQAEAELEQTEAAIEGAAVTPAAPEAPEESSALGESTDAMSPREKTIDVPEPVSVSEEGTNPHSASEGYIQSYTEQAPMDSADFQQNTEAEEQATVAVATSSQHGSEYGMARGEEDVNQWTASEQEQSEGVQDEDQSPPPRTPPPPPPEYENLGEKRSDSPAQQPEESSLDVSRDVYVMPGVKAIDVELDQGPGMPHRLIRILLDYTQIDQKPYIGGYRNKRTEVVYHHAVTQTPRKPKYTEKDRKYSRETQTVKQLTRSQQTQREQGTQMARPGVLLDDSEDRVMTPRPYITADEVWAIKEKATRTIQRFTRGWFGRKRAAELRRLKAEREAFLAEQEAKRVREAEELRRKEIERRMHPRTAADFEILYNELEAWRLQETRKIKEAGMDHEKEHEALQQLLHKETKLLQTIDRLKIEAHSENKDVRVHKMLNNMAKPKAWELKNGAKVEVHTPFTTRAKELSQLYEGLNIAMLTIDERLDVLLHVKWTVKEFDCNLTREIVDLIDREADLLNRGRNPKTLEGLRKRISSLFLTFIETPEFNPESAQFQVVPMDFESYVYEHVDKAAARTLPVPVNATAKYA